MLRTGPSPPGPGHLHFLQNLEPLFIPFLNLLQREETLIHIVHDQSSELIPTIMMRFLKQSAFGCRQYGQ